MTAPSMPSAAPSMASVGRQLKYPHLVKDVFPSRSDYLFSDDGTVVVSVKVTGLKKFLEKPRAAFWAHSVNKTLVWGERQIKTREVNQGEATLKITFRPNGRLGECVVMKIVPYSDGEKDVFSKLYKTTETTTIFINFDQSLPPLVEILRSETVEALARSVMLKREALLQERELEDKKFRDLLEKLEELRNLADF